MKKLQFITMAFLIFFLSACNQEPQQKTFEEKEIPTEDLINQIDVHDLHILVIDKCEYIFYKKSPGINQGYGFMAHKGNCKNPIHYYSRSKPKD